MLEPHHEGMHYKQQMDIYHALDFISELSDEVCKHFLLLLLEFEKRCCQWPWVHISEEVKFELLYETGK